jgi:hypothetical protein
MTGTKGVSDGGTIRIAMWSGPRNLSTAMMRSFGNRPDCDVADEPFYGPYLKLTGLNHPMREQILRHHETDWRKVAASVAGAGPTGKAVFYQKHMTHHMLPEIGRDWMSACRHAFLIRHPARVLASYAAKHEPATLRDIGFLEQAELFDRAADIMGKAPPVVDAEAILEDPRAVLTRLCTELGIDFRAEMLSWPPGLRATDGIWATHWYDAVKQSTGFGKLRPTPQLEDDGLRKLEEQALPIYERLAAHALN